MNGINPAATAIVGTYEMSDGSTTSFMSQGTILTTLQFPGSTTTFANGVNNAGIVVGSFIDADGLGHGFTWTPPSAPQKGH